MTSDDSEPRKTHAGRHAIDESLILALAGGQSVRSAARQLGIGEKTVSRRMADPEFRRRVREARDELLDQAAGQLVSSLSGASDALVRLLESSDERVVLAAACRLLELSLRFHDALAVSARIAALEAVVAGANPIGQANSPPATDSGA